METTEGRQLIAAVASDYIHERLAERGSVDAGFLVIDDYLKQKPRHRTER